MVKLSGRWSLHSPKRKTGKETTQKTRGTAGAAPAPDPAGTQEPDPILQTTGARRSRPKAHARPGGPHPEGSGSPVSSRGASSASGREGSGVGSRSPLLGMRKLVKKINPMSPRASGENKSRGDSESPRRTGGVTTRYEEDPGAVSACPEDQAGASAGKIPTGNTQSPDLSYSPPTPEDAAESEECKDDLQPDGGAQQVVPREGVQANQVPLRITFIGVFLNGIAVALASFAPAGGNKAKHLVKALLREPSTPVLPGGRYTSTGSVLAVYMLVGHKNRVYACVAAADAPSYIAFGLLEEVQIKYLFNVSGLAFSTTENAHNKRCHAELWKSWVKYEGIQAALAQERETRRLLGEEPLDIEAPASRGDYTRMEGEVVQLKFMQAQQGALLEATREMITLASSPAPSCSPVGRKKHVRVAGVLGAAVLVVFLVSWAARCVTESCPCLS